MVVFRSDPCGIICMIVTYAAIIYADYVIVRHLVLPAMSDTLWGMLNVLVFNTIAFMMTVSHFRAVLSDPGIVPLPSTGLDFSDLHSGKTTPNMDNALRVHHVGIMSICGIDSSELALKRDGWSVCMKCETYRPPRAHHCRICRRCIRRMDHHCPWINNCVGEFNQKYFIQFLFYVGLASLHAVAMVILSWVMDPGVNNNTKHIKLVHSVLLVVECMLFGMFVIAIGCDQMSSIINDETAVEHVKKDGHRRQPKSTFALLQEVFGRGHPCLWLCPLTQFSPVPTEAPLQYNV